ncbi:MAG: tRNA-intron lyase [Candidatus Nanoarchaeia archaeon]|nr:tRNA-intron lyase [Candidatus Nanoarchaeia archaeon]
MMYDFEISGNEIINKNEMQNNGNFIESFKDKYKEKFGIINNNLLFLNQYEALYLLEKDEINVFSRKNIIKKNKLIKLFSKTNKNFLTNYIIYKDLVSKGYQVRTGYKYGAQFRIYEKNTSIKDEHSKWLVYPVNEKEKFTWYDFSAKNRVAHSTKKRLVIAVLDNEKDITYYEVKWIRT